MLRFLKNRRIIEKGMVKNMKKKLFMLALAGTLVVSATACGKKDNDTTAGTEVQTESQTDAIKTDETEAVGANREDYVPVSELNTDDYVTLMDYKNMVIEVEKVEVTDEIIKNYINQNVLDKVPVTDKVAENGDTVTIDFVGKKDGEAFEGGTGTDYPLTLGSNSFIPGFEEKLVGVKPGETVDLDLTFPKDYFSAELAGQDVVFTVTVKNILVNGDYDTISDEKIAEMLDGKTKDDIWAEAKQVVEEDADNSYESSIANAIIEQLMENCTVSSIPDFLVEEEVVAYNNFLEQISNAYYGCDLETYITTYYNLSMDEYTEQINDMANETVKQYLIMEAISRKEGFVVTEEELMEKAKEEAATYGYESAEQVLEATGKTTYRLPMVQERVLDFLKKNVTIK